MQHLQMKVESQDRMLKKCSNEIEVSSFYFFDPL
jgi:hypothetical protein